MSALAVALPATKQPAAGTTLLGSSSDVGSQSLAQRLSRRLGRPVFVSLNLPDVAHLRAFAEREGCARQVVHEQRVAARAVELLSLIHI